MGGVEVTVGPKVTTVRWRRNARIRFRTIQGAHHY